MANNELSSLAVVNQVLSRLAVGVRGTQQYIADLAIPTIPVDQENVTWPQFTNEQVQSVQAGDDVRAIDADPQDVLLDSIGSASAVLDEHMLRGKIDYRRVQAAQNSAGGAAVNALRLRYVAKVKNRILIGKEKNAAAILFASGKYGSNTGAGGDWSASATKVRDLIFSKMEAIQKATGYMPNRLLLGRKARRALLQNPDIFAGRQYSKGGFVSDDDLASFFEMQPGNVIVGTAVTQTKAAAGKAGTATSIWTEDSAALYYAAPTEDQASDLNPSFAYNMQLTYNETGTREMVKSWVDGIFERFVYGQTYTIKDTFSGTNGAGWLFTGITGAS